MHFYESNFYLIPLSFLVGVCSGSVSFTAWTLIVPLFFDGVGIDLYTAIYLSVCVDLVCSFSSTLVYAVVLREKFPVVHGLGFSFIGALMSGMMAPVFLPRLQHFEGLLHGALGAVDIVLGVIFGLRGVIEVGIYVWKRQRRRELELLGFVEGVEVLEAPAPAADIQSGAEDEHGAGRLLDDRVLVVAPPPGARARGPRFSVLRQVALGVTLVFAVLTGLYAAFLGIGCGFLFVFYFVLFLQSEFVPAVAAGNLAMFLITATLAALIPFIEKVDFDEISQRLPVLAAFSVIGTIVGALGVLRVPKFVATFIAGTILISMGIIISIQQVLL